MTKMCFSFLLVFVCSVLNASVGWAADRAATPENLQLIKESFQAHLQFSVPGMGAEIKNEIDLRPEVLTPDILEKTKQGIPVPAQALRRINIRFSNHTAGAEFYRIQYLSFEARVDTEARLYGMVEARLIRGEGTNAYEAISIIAHSSEKSMYPQLKTIFDEIYRQLSDISLGDCETSLL